MTTLTGEELDRLEDEVRSTGKINAYAKVLFALLAMARLSLEDGGACTSERFATPKSADDQPVAPSAVWRPVSELRDCGRELLLVTGRHECGEPWWNVAWHDEDGLEGEFNDATHFQRLATPSDRSLDDDGSATLPADKSSPKPPPPEASPEVRGENVSAPTDPDEQFITAALSYYWGGPASDDVKAAWTRILDRRSTPPAPEGDRGKENARQWLGQLPPAPTLNGEGS